MPAPGEHKTVQARILAYAQEIGWTFVARDEAEVRRGFGPQITQISADSEPGEINLRPSSVTSLRLERCCTLPFDGLFDAREMREPDLTVIDSGSPSPLRFDSHPAPCRPKFVKSSILTFP